MKKRVARLNRETYESLKRQHEAFKEKFGRQPIPGDPLFFDPDSDVSTPLSESKLRSKLTNVARKAGLDVARVLNAFGFEVEKEGCIKDFNQAKATRIAPGIISLVEQLPSGQLLCHDATFQLFSHC